MSDDEEDFGPNLVIVPGDCEFFGYCGLCWASFGSVRPDQSLDVLGERWDRHVHRSPACHKPT